MDVYVSHSSHHHVQSAQEFYTKLENSNRPSLSSRATLFSVVELPEEELQQSNDTSVDAIKNTTLVDLYDPNHSQTSVESDITSARASIQQSKIDVENIFEPFSSTSKPQSEIVMKVSEQQIDPLDDGVLRHSESSSIENLVDALKSFRFQPEKDPEIYKTKKKALIEGFGVGDEDIELIESKIKKHFESRKKFAKSKKHAKKVKFVEPPISDLEISGKTKDAELENINKRSRLTTILDEDSMEIEEMAKEMFREYETWEMSKKAGNGTDWMATLFGSRTPSQMSLDNHSELNPPNADWIRRIFGEKKKHDINVSIETRHKI